jgi:hypothetical protein
LDALSCRETFLLLTPSFIICFNFILFLVLEFSFGNYEFAYYKQDAQRISYFSELETQLSYHNIASTTIFNVDLIAAFVSKGVSMLQAWELAPQQRRSPLVRWALLCATAK